MKPRLYLVLKISEFSKSLTAENGIPIAFTSGPKYFCPVFERKKDAVKWAGDKKLVREVERA
jgi:hypothetical protein